MSAIDGLDLQLGELRRLVDTARALCPTGRPRIDIAALFACAPLVQRKTASYPGPHGRRVFVAYDPTTPCRACGLPVVWASVVGPGVCAWCDTGAARPG